MFTGIIEMQGKVSRVERRGAQVRLAFLALEKKTLRFKKGESVAVNGVCLTVAREGAGRFEADVVGETLKATTLGLLRPGSIVNLEPALKFGDPLGGHLVTGHVDGSGKITRIERTGKNVIFWIRVPEKLRKFMAPKGSVAVDGISLTIQGSSGNRIKIAIIPHTLRHTHFRLKRAGESVNLEADLVARYLKWFGSVPGHRAKPSLERFFKPQGVSK